MTTYVPTGGQTIFPRINYLKNYAARAAQRDINGRIFDAPVPPSTIGDVTFTLDGNSFNPNTVTQVDVGVEHTIVAAIDGDAATATARGAIDFDLDANSEVAANGGDFRTFTGHVDTAIGRLNGYMNQVGIDQRSLSGKEVNLTEAITANSAARSRIMDTDFAKEQSNSIRLQILQQTATAALSQANMGPQAVLGFLG